MHLKRKISQKNLPLKMTQLQSSLCTNLVFICSLCLYHDFIAGQHLVALFVRPMLHDFLQEAVAFGYSLSGNRRAVSVDQRGRTADSLPVATARL